jgi:hypothetical protein
LEREGVTTAIIFFISGAVGHGRTGAARGSKSMSRRVIDGKARFQATAEE